MPVKRRMPKIVKVIGLFWVVAITVSLMSSVASASTAKNNINVSFGSTVTSNYTTGYAEKTTASSCFISNYYESSTDFNRINVYGGDVGVTWVDCTAGSPRICYRGGTTPLPNYVKERGYNYTCLTISYNANPYVVLKGYWQADI